MRRIDWDKVRRDRNAKKPHYRDDWERNWYPSLLEAHDLPSGVPASKPVRFSPENPKTAAGIRKRLRRYGMAGKTLTDTTNAILRGEAQLAWVEFDLEVESMRKSGFSPCAPVKDSSQIVLRFEKLSLIGEVEEVRTLTLRKAAVVQVE